MIKVIHTIAPEEDMLFDDILSFETDNYVGMFDYQSHEWIMMERDSDILYLKRINCCVDNLAQLDKIVYDIVEEHIVSVSDSSAYCFAIIED